LLSAEVVFLVEGEAGGRSVDCQFVHLKTCVVPRGRTGFCEGSVAVESFESGGKVKKIAWSAAVMRERMRSVASMCIDILEVNQNLAQRRRTRIGPQ
jgi:hypothetical protein